MIDNSTLYEKVLVEDGLNEVKHLRDQWNYSSENKLLGGLTDLCNICGADGDQYSYIVKAVKSATLETIFRTIHALIDAYNVKADPIPFCDFHQDIHTEVGFSKFDFAHMDRGNVK